MNEEELKEELLAAGASEAMVEKTDFSKKDLKLLFLILMKQGFLPPTAAVKSGLTEAGFYGSSLLQSNIYNNKFLTGTGDRSYPKHLPAEDNISVEEVKYNY